MPRDVRADPDRAAGVRPPAASEPAREPGAGHGGDAGGLGQAISARLFSAGLDLNSALMLCRDGPVADRLWHAVAELDEAIKDLRHLLLAVPGPAAGADPARRPRDQGTRPP